MSNETLQIPRPADRSIVPVFCRASTACSLPVSVLLKLTPVPLSCPCLSSGRLDLTQVTFHT